MEHLNFLMAAIRDKNVASVAPTSFASVRQICKRLDFSRPLNAVEYGPGTGAFTKYLLKKLPVDSMLVAIELNRRLSVQLQRYSRRRKARKPRLVVVNDDARNVQAILKSHGIRQVDFALSGIPFSFIDDVTKKQIIDRTFHILKPGGLFLVYQVSYHVRGYLKERFGEVRSSRALLNIPPLCVMEVSKRSSVNGEQLGGQSLQPSVLIDAR